MRATGEAMDKQLEGKDQTGYPDLDKLAREQTCLAFAVTQCVDRVSILTTQSRD